MTPPSPASSRSQAPCLTNTASVSGLNALIRAHPKDWHTLLRRHAPRPPLHHRATIGEVVGTAFDEAALPRGRSDQGRLRTARWCAATLARHAGDTRIVAVDEACAEEIEQHLIDAHSIAPSSARKARAHLLALRDFMAQRLGVEGLERTPPPDRPVPWVPRLTWEDYAATRPHLSWGLRLACDLLATCRLRPATVLALRGQDVGPDGRSLQVQGRKDQHTLSVPAFLRADLALLVKRGERAAPLFPGRTRGGTLGVAALRRRFRAAAEVALEQPRDLRDLSDLAASLLGPASGNPSGRGAALSRLAPRWASADAPPPSDVLAATRSPSGKQLDLDERLRVIEEHMAALDGRTDDHLTALREDTWRAFAKVQRQLDTARRGMEALQAGAPQPAQVERRLSRLESIATKAADRRIEERRRLPLLHADLDELRARVKEAEKSAKRARGAALTLSGLFLASTLRPDVQRGGRTQARAAEIFALAEEFAAEYPDSAAELHRLVEGLFEAVLP